MPVRFQASAGKIAVYAGSDDLPFTTPLSYLSRVKFHSALDYIPFNVAPLTATLSRIATDSGRNRLMTVGAHGAAGVPFVFGNVNISGVLVPLCGSVPVYSDSNGNVILWTIGVDATNVAIHEQRTAASLGSATNFDVTIYVSTKLVA